MARRKTGTGHRAIALYVQAFYPHIVEEAAAYYEAEKRKSAERARAAYRAAQITKLEQKLEPLKTRLAALGVFVGILPEAPTPATLEANGAGIYEEFEQAGAVVLR